MIVKNLSESVNVGSVTVGLSGDIMDKVSATSNAETAKHQSNDLKKVLEAMSKNSDIMNKVTEIFKINNQINK